MIRSKFFVKTGKARRKFSGLSVGAESSNLNAAPCGLAARKSWVHIGSRKPNFKSLKTSCF